MKQLYIQRIRAFQSNNTPFVFLIMTPEHGNMGDHAIAYAETELLRQAGISFIEITGRQLFVLKYYNLLGVMNKYPIMINGGGNLGTLWIDVEHIQRSIICANPKSHIMIFPNTIFYESSPWGEAELGKSLKIYNSHEHLTIFARENISYDFMRTRYRDIRLMPDMAMSLPPQTFSHDRRGCLLCLRGDREKTRTGEQEAILRLQVQEIFGEDVSDTDMVVPHRVAAGNRKDKLYEKLDEFSRAKLVVTDRLHGMVFCAITGTPCIVIDSKSPKIRGCYEWIRHLEYIRFVDDVCDIASVYAGIPDRQYVYDNSSLLPYYDELAKVVKNSVENHRNCTRI